MSIRNELLEQILVASGGILPDARVELVELGEFKTSIAQTPSGLGDAGKIRINFGTGGSTSGGEVTVAADGLITFATSDIQYRFDTLFAINRTSEPLEARLVGRMMFAADGIEANAVQLGDTFAVEVADANSTWREEMKIEIKAVAGAILWFNLARDESGIDEGGLEVYQPSGTLSGWDTAPTARLRINKAIIVQ